MLIRSINIPDHVLPIIASMEWDDQNGTILGMLTCGQVDRQTYVAVNTVLDALGGKWNRKHGGHLFATDPRPQLAEMMSAGTLTIEKDGYFPTPPEIGHAMAVMAELQPGQLVLEPSAGTGELAQAILAVEPGVNLVCGEKNRQRVDVLVSKGLVARQWDFLEVEGDEHHDRIVQNPPFENSQDIDHILHAYDCLAPAGILISVMSEGSFFRSDRKVLAFIDWLAGVPNQVTELPAGAFKASGTNVKARIVKVWK